MLKKPMGKEGWKEEGAGISREEERRTTRNCEGRKE